MASHAVRPEAGYSTSQIDNIVKPVVPNQELLDAQAELAFTCFEETASSDVAPTPITSPSTKSAKSA